MSCSLATCAPLSHEQPVSTSNDGISEPIVSAEPEEFSKLLTTDNSDYTIKELSFSGPMCTDLVIENSKKVYSKSIDDETQDYLSLAFDSENDFASIGWWPDGNKVQLQFWNINHKKEAEFSIDGANFKLIFPEAS